MEQIKIIRKINEASSKCYTSEFNEHDSYLERCNGFLFSFLKESLKERFLFSALTYRKESNKKPFGIIKGNEEGTNYNFADCIKDNNDFINAIKNLLNDASNSVTINLTHHLLSKKVGHDLFLIDSNSNYSTDIINGKTIIGFDLSELQFREDKDEFLRFNVARIKQFISILKLQEKIGTEKYGKYLWHYKNIEGKYKTYFPGKSFYIHFIRPSIIDLDYNLLLSLATNDILKIEELSFINLVNYRIVSQTAIEKVVEAKKKSRSLTTHSFKTELNTTLIPQLNLIKENINNKEKLSRLINDHQEQLEDVYVLTGIISLMDKINEKDIFLESGIREHLLGEEVQEIDIFQQCSIYNRKNPSLDNIEIQGEISLCFNIRIYDKYLSKQLVKLFYNTIFENINLYGKRENGKIILIISQSSNKWIFENSSKVKTFRINETKLRGNLLLFKTLIEETDSGKFNIEMENYKFTLTYQMNK